MKLTIIDGKNIMEGFTAVIFLWTFTKLLDYYCIECSRAFEFSLVFGLTWIMRKLSVNIYTEILLPRGIKIPTLSI